MRIQLIANYKYLAKIAEKLRGRQAEELEYKLIRKEVYVSTANMASAYQRMISEPKSKQKNVREASKFLVLNHKINSYATILFETIASGEHRMVSPIHVKLLRKALHRLWEAINLLNTADDERFAEADLQMPADAVNDLDGGADDKLITEQLEFVSETAGDILNTARRFLAEEGK